MLYLIEKPGIMQSSKTYYIDLNNTKVSLKTPRAAKFRDVSSAILKKTSYGPIRLHRTVKETYIT